MTKHYEAINIGLVRSRNEDALAVIEPETYLVADGMGGQAAGEIASRMLVSSIETFLRASDHPWNERVLEKAILRAGERIYDAAQNREEYKGMGTTATMIHFDCNRAYFAHVGDSRLYQLKNARLQQLTEDHSYVESLVRNGEISQAAARIHPMKNYLTQAVGAMPDITVDTGSLKIKSGDVFLLCTDGLTNMVSDEEIMQIISSSQQPADALVKAALENGGKDNVTVIVVGVA